MHKKTQRNNYALASSSISDIPLTLQQKEIQAFNKYAAVQFKQNSSIYHTFNQSRSQADESISLHFSTAKPFYEQVAEDYYNERQMGERVNYNKQSQDHFIMQRVKQKKSPNKRLMIYSYSNIVLFHKKIEKIFLNSKKRVFITLSRVKKEQKMHLLNNNKKNASFYSGETNNTSREDALYRVSFGHRREDRYDLHQYILQGVNIIQAWLEYRLLLDKRKIFNSIFQYGNDRKKFSLQLSQSLKVDNAHNQNNFLTDYHHSNEVSLTQGLPQQIQESLVYTLEHNSELTRKQLTQSTLQKFPTLKKYPSSTKSYEKLTSHEIQNDTSKKNSPMYKLKALSNSPPEKQQINFASPLRLQMLSMKKKKVNMERLMDEPLQFELNMYQTQNKIDQHEQTVGLNEIKANISTYDQYQSTSMDADLKRLFIDKGNKCLSQRAIENSAKHSDVSNYRMDHTAHNQEQEYQIIANYNSQPIMHDQTVLRKHAPQPFNERNTPAKFQKYYFSNREVNPAITTPKFISEIQNEEKPIPSRNAQQKPMNQLQNDRIRIYARPNHPQSTRQAIAATSSRTSKLRGNFLSPNLQNTPGFSPHAPSITISSEKRIYSPMIQSQRLYQNQLVHNQLPPHQHQHLIQQPPPPRIVEQPLRYQRINRSPEYQIQRPIIQSPRIQQQIKPVARYIQLPIKDINQEIRYTMSKEQIPISPRQVGPNIAQNKTIVNKPSPRIIQKNLIAQPKSINQMRQIQSKQKMQNNLKRQDYGLFSNNSQQRPQYAVVNNIYPSQNCHLANVQKQYQLPQSQMKCFKLQAAPAQAPIMNVAQNSRQTALMMKYSPRVEDKVEKRPQSSASSPKLFFNYKSNHQSHIDEEIVLNSNHITKNSSSISRPKSMNSKLFVTLRKEL